jgi:predicted membrane-bound dolichyl-phosphate-mannose-protein mannosyltransferase
MAFLDNLEKLMIQNNIKNLNTLSKSSNIPYTTLKNFYVRGTENIGISTLKKLAEYFNVTLDYLVYGETLVKCTNEEYKLLTTFRSLNEQGQEYIMQTMDMVKDKYIKSDSLSTMENAE